MSANGCWQRISRGVLDVAALALLLSAAACAPAAQSGVTETAADPALGPALASDGCVALSSVEGNGLSGNGLAGNGLCQNGLAAQGLDLAGLNTSSFVAWFNVDSALSEVVMRYLYKCAAPSGTSLTWKNPATGTSYTWAGGLGLAPGWTGGATATVAEQQVVTACLGALTNKFGVSTTIAVEGRTATGVQLAITAGELTTFSVKEACFFGNLFTGQGVYAGTDHPVLSASESSVRACGLDTSKSGTVNPECPPMIYVGACGDFCRLDGTKTFFESCSYGGVAYRPLTTRLKPSDIYKCGDGVCQFTERCGVRSEWYQCRDCGPCP